MSSTIEKDIILNWLKSAPVEVNIEEIGRWIECKSKGEFKFLYDKKN
jgi:hypothetical protein